MSTLSPSVQEQGLRPFTLDHDTLSEIFILCADMTHKDEDHIPAVDTVRRISQVSSTWRQLVLSSPLLWARVINLNRFWDCSPEWLNEVARRAKTSGFYVKAEVFWDVHDTVERSKFIRKFVGEHWRRIHDLDLIIKLDDFEEAKAWLSLLSSPSDIQYLRILSTIQTWELFPLSCPHLRALELSDDSGSLLFIPGGADSPRFPSAGRTSFPSLKRLDIKGHWPSSVAGIMSILERINPADDCSLYFDCTVDASESSSELESIPAHIALVLPKYLRHVKEHFSSIESPFVSVVITKKRIDLFMSPSGPSTHDDDEFRFALEFADSRDTLTHFIRNFITSFESLKLRQVNELSLLIHHDEDIALAAMVQLAETFPSVVNLEVDASTLLQCIKIFQKPAGLISFPALKDVTIGLADPMTPGQLAELPHLLGGTSQTQVHLRTENLSEFW